MAVLKRTVKKYGARGAHITVPSALLNKEVVIVTDETINELEELIEKTLIVRKLDILEREEFSRKFEEFKNEVYSRLLRLERTVFQ